MDLKILQDTPPWDWPRGIGQKFLSILRDPKAKASDRLLAADLAGDFTVISDPLAHALLAIVGNAAEPEELRAAAAISLGPALEQADIDEFDDPESVPISEPRQRHARPHRDGGHDASGNHAGRYRHRHQRRRSTL